MSLSNLQICENQIEGLIQKCGLRGFRRYQSPPQYQSGKDANHQKAKSLSSLSVKGRSSVFSDAIQFQTKTTDSPQKGRNKIETYNYLGTLALFKPTQKSTRIWVYETQLTHH